MGNDENQQVKRLEELTQKIANQKDEILLKKLAISNIESKINEKKEEIKNEKISFSDSIKSHDKTINENDLLFGEETLNFRQKTDIIPELDNKIDLITHKIKIESNEMMKHDEAVKKKEIEMEQLVEDKAKKEADVLNNQEKLEETIVLKENVNIQIDSQSDFKLVENTNEEGLTYLTIAMKSSSPISEIFNLFWTKLDQCRFVIMACKAMTFTEKKLYIEQLNEITNLGISQGQSNLNIASQRLKRLENEIMMYKSSRIRNRFLINNLLTSFAFASVGIILALILNRFVKPESYSIYPLVWSSSMIGAWISIASRKMELEFVELVEMEQERLSVYMKFFFIGASTSLFLLFLHSGLISVSIANITYESLLKNLELQILLGIIIGGLEGRIVTDLFSKTKNIITK